MPTAKTTTTTKQTTFKKIKCDECGKMFDERGIGAHKSHHRSKTSPIVDGDVIMIPVKRSELISRISVSKLIDFMLGESSPQERTPSKE